MAHVMTGCDHKTLGSDMRKSSYIASPLRCQYVYRRRPCRAAWPAGTISSRGDIPGSHGCCSRSGRPRRERQGLINLVRTSIQTLANGELDMQRDLFGRPCHA